MVEGRNALAALQQYVAHCTCIDTSVVALGSSTFFIFQGEKQQSLFPLAAHVRMLFRRGQHNILAVIPIPTSVRAQESITI